MPLVVNQEHLWTSRIGARRSTNWTASWCELINERATCALEIGKLKRNSAMPVYEPDRERIIFENIARMNHGPLSQIQLRQVYERLIDVMRQMQTVRDGAGADQGRADRVNWQPRD